MNMLTYAMRERIGNMRRKQKDYFDGWSEKND